MTGVHTNTIEGLWAHVKRLLIGGGTTRRNLYGYLATYMLRRRLNTQIEEDPFVKFINLAHEWSVSGLPIGNHSLLVPGPDPELDGTFDMISDPSDTSDTDSDIDVSPEPLLSRLHLLRLSLLHYQRLSNDLQVH